MEYSDEIRFFRIIKEMRRRNLESIQETAALKDWTPSSFISFAKGYDEGFARALDEICDRLGYSFEEIVEDESEE